MPDSPPGRPGGGLPGVAFVLTLVCLSIVVFLGVFCGTPFLLDGVGGFRVEAFDTKWPAFATAGVAAAIAAVVAVIAFKKK